ncbi:MULTISPECIES: hypothetical protein [unclassified Thermosipho (in: thermotogales)]|uniref:hypothetical protein n=1 Tax=unclassified Thermosipho (in: thermotogales) TaxID=2676525 RepID=UPI000984B210|nr:MULTISPECIES: hypothetical protein [unclassified Thermosipho (in: thermotogales)]MBT1248060.1 hypothetical protein [Thermosipho sp. 1244]OOC46653.1 hypothetical protein XO09_05800 [Thermosipho sp. 1223]
MKKIIIFVSLIFGILSLIKLNIFFFFLYLILNLIDLKVLDLIGSIIFFPYYPIIKTLLITPKKPKYIPIEFKEKNIETFIPNFKSVDLAPFNIIIKHGSVSQKKEAIRLLFELLKKEQIDFLEGLRLLYLVIKVETNQDVILYTTEAINNIENLLLEKLSKINNKVEYAKYSFYYALSPFLTENQKTDILISTKKTLLQFLEKYPLNIEAILLLLDVLQELGENTLIEKILDEKLKKLKFQPLFEKAILYYLKQRNIKKVKELLNAFYSYNFSFKNEALKILLEG